MSIEQRLKELNLELPAVTPPVANYVNAVLGPATCCSSPARSRWTPDGKFLTGKVGKDVSVEEAYKHARLAGLHLIADHAAELGDLDRVKRVVKVLGMVNAVPELRRAAQGDQRLLGPDGRGLRRQGPPRPLRRRRRQPTAEITVEIEAIVEVE